MSKWHISYRGDVSPVLRDPDDAYDGMFNDAGHENADLRQVYRELTNYSLLNATRKPILEFYAFRRMPAAWFWNRWGFVIQRSGDSRNQFLVPMPWLSPPVAAICLNMDEVVLAVREHIDFVSQMVIYDFYDEQNITRFLVRKAS